MDVDLGFVHHGNPYLLTDGSDSKAALSAVTGSTAERAGLSWVPELHRLYNLPANLHISGTLLEAIAWYQPPFLAKIRELYQEGLIEFVGSCYGQNVMRFCSYDHNPKQINEELALYQLRLGIEPTQIKTFWPPSGFGTRSTWLRC